MFFSQQHEQYFLFLENAFTCLHEIHGSANATYIMAQIQNNTQEIKRIKNINVCIVLK